MNEELLNTDGSLRDEFKLAAYFDSCVLIDYWLAYERPDEHFNNSDMYFFDEDYDDNFERWTWESVLSDLEIIDKKVAIVRNIRNILQSKNQIHCIVSPLALCELAEWYTEERFKRILLHSYQAKKVSSLHDSTIRKQLIKMHKAYRKDIDNGIKVSKAIKALKEVAFGLAPPIQDPYLPDVEIDDFLKGLLRVDLKNFSWLSESVERIIAVLSFYQIGLGDIFHILVANHLGCKYFVSWDSDFKGDMLEKIIKDKFNLELIKSQEALERLLRQNIVI